MNDRRRMQEWVDDDGWAKQKRYLEDELYFSCVGDILSHEKFELMENYIQHGNTTCRTHCLQVSYLTYRICRAVRLDYRQAARAGLLHDLFLYDWHTHGKLTGERFHGFTHPRKALLNAVRYFELTKKEEDMILRHMWPLTPIPPRSMEGLALIYADKFCSSAEIISHMRNQLMIKVGIYHGILGKITE